MKQAEVQSDVFVCTNTQLFEDASLMEEFLCLAAKLIAEVLASDTYLLSLCVLMLSHPSETAMMADIC